MQNQFLQEIIKSDFSVLPDEDKNKSSKWFVGVQMFRIEGPKIMKESHLLKEYIKMSTYFVAFRLWLN